MQQIALSIQTDHLTAGTISRVDAHGTFLSQRWSQQQLPEIFGKDTDSLFVRLFFAECGKFCFYRWFQQSLIGIVYSFCHLCGTFPVSVYILPFQPFGTGCFIVGSDGNLQDTFGFSTADGEQTVRGTFLQRFTEVEIVAVFQGSFFFLFALDYFRDNHGLTAELVSYQVAGTFIFVHLLGDDVACSFQRIFFVLDFSLDERTYPGRQIVFPLHQQQHGKRFQSLLACNLGTSFPFGLERQVNIFQFRRIPAVGNTLTQGIGQFSLLFDSRKYRFLSLGKFAELFVTRMDITYLYLVESSGRFFSVTAYKGYGSTSLKQFQGVFYPMDR